MQRACRCICVSSSMTTPLPLPHKNIGASCCPKICFVFIFGSKSETSREHRPRRLQNSTSHKLVWNYLLRPFHRSCMTRESPSSSTFHLSQRRRFSFPIDINFDWSHKFVTHPYQHKYWNILLLDFHYHSTHIKFPIIVPINTTLYSPTQLFEPFWFLFVNIIVKLFTCLFVWFTTLCFVLSLQPYAYL